MLFRLLALFIVVPVIEMALLIRIGQVFGFWPAIGLIVLTGLLGGILARRQGASVWQAFNARLSSGQLPGRELMDGLIVLVAGALLITPGVLTDFTGFLGLLPPTRAWIRDVALKRLEKAHTGGTIRFSVGGFHTATTFRSSPDEEATWQGTARSRPGHSNNPATPPANDTTPAD